MAVQNFHGGFHISAESKLMAGPSIKINELGGPVYPPTLGRKNIYLPILKILKEHAFFHSHI
jgi:hypothetical protein